MSQGAVCSSSELQDMNACDDQPTTERRHIAYREFSLDTQGQSCTTAGSKKPMLYKCGWMRI
jgi:hypothetical protein